VNPREPERSSSALEILGCRLDAIDAEEAAARILTRAQDSSGAQVVTLGTEMVVHAQHDVRFRTIINSCAFSLCDTVGLLAVARRRGAELRGRVAGVELIERLCAGAAQQGLRVYFLGGADGVAADAAAILEARFPGLQVAGARSGYFREEEAAAVAAAIRESEAKLLFVGMGSPRQEFWIAEWVRAMGCGAAMGVGGSFDVIAGRVRRAPAIFRRFGLEWFYRLLKEPHRWRRQLALPRFIWLVALDELGLGRARKIS
jgi:N-acetylglucosaminyldiphosphoundecaprenol N-acetyl-beta-D-mannosaminyltransferase